MSNGTETDASSKSSYRQQNFRDWVDTGAKLIGALAIAGVTLIGYNYQTKASESSVINQREQAESQLRASMLSDLVEPIIGQKGGVSEATDLKGQLLDKNGAASGDADLERRLLLAEMVTLNFHDHFEFKPLLLDVDAKFLVASKDAAKPGSEARAKLASDARAKLASDARRVIDRQINMLTSIDGISGNGGTDGYRTKTTEVGLMNSKDLKNSVTAPRGKCMTKGNILAKKPTLTEPTFICVTSPDNKICLLIRFTSSPVDYDNRSITMKRAIIYRHARDSRFWPGVDQNSDCSTPHGSVERLDEAHVSIFDFPLTDNSKIMWEGDEYRYSVSLYEITDADRPIRLKLVWFPEGFVTERERPPPRQLR